MNKNGKVEQIRRMIQANPDIILTEYEVDTLFDHIDSLQEELTDCTEKLTNYTDQFRSL